MAPPPLPTYQQLDLESRRPSAVCLMALGGVGMVLGGLLQVSGWSSQWLVRAHASPVWLHETWAALTLLGFGWPLLILGVAHAGQRAGALALLSKTALLATVATQLPKLLWPHPRPALVLDPSQLAIVGEPVMHSGSMPSGHALAVFAVLGAAWLSGRSRTPGNAHKVWAQGLGWVMAWALAALVAWSRVAVGAHWQADVFVGAGVGLCVAGLAWRWECGRPWQAWFERRAGRQALLMFLVVACVAWALTRTGYPSVQWLQWALAGLAMLEVARRLRGLALGAERAAPARSGAAPV